MGDMIGSLVFLGIFAVPVLLTLGVLGLIADYMPDSTVEKFLKFMGM